MNFELDRVSALMKACSKHLVRRQAPMNLELECLP